MTTQAAITALEEMRKYYKERDLAAKEWKAKGGKVLGYMCNNTPEEIIYAAGMLPIRIVGDPECATTVGDLYMEDSFCPFVRSVFDLTLRGRFNHFDKIVIPHSCDAIIRMAKYLWSVKDLEGTEFPEMYWIDMPHHRGLISYEFFLGRVKDFKEKMEELSGKSISDNDLLQTIEVYNKNRILLQKVVELRRADPPRISGTEALQIIGSGVFMPKEQHNKLLEQLLSELDKFSAKSGSRLFVSGSCMDNTAFMELIESCGAVVVGDDTCLSDRYTENPVEITDDPVEALTRRYLLKAPCPRVAPKSIRAQDFAQRLQDTKPQGVIFYILRWCDAHMWDYVGLAKEVVKASIPHYYLDMQEYYLANPESLRTRIEAFLESIAAET